MISIAAEGAMSVATRTGPNDQISSRLDRGAWLAMQAIEQVTTIRGRLHRLTLQKRARLMAQTGIVVITADKDIKPEWRRHARKMALLGVLFAGSRVQRQGRRVKAADKMVIAPKTEAVSDTSAVLELLRGLERRHRTKVGQHVACVRRYARPTRPKDEARAFKVVVGEHRFSNEPPPPTMPSPPDLIRRFFMGLRS
jgi:hypothetical protein